MHRYPDRFVPPERRRHTAVKSTADGRLYAANTNVTYFLVIPASGRLRGKQGIANGSLKHGALLNGLLAGQGKARFRGSLPQNAIGDVLTEGGTVLEAMP